MILELDEYEVIFVKVNNVLHYASGKILAYDGVEVVKAEMLEYATKHGATSVGQFIVLVRNARADSGKITAYDILLPLDKAVPDFGRPKYRFHDEYELEGCIMSKYQGHFLPPISHYIWLEREIQEYLDKKTIEKKGNNKR